MEAHIETAQWQYSENSMKKKFWLQHMKKRNFVPSNFKEISWLTQIKAPHWLSNGLPLMSQGSSEIPTLCSIVKCLTAKKNFQIYPPKWSFFFISLPCCHTCLLASKVSIVYITVISYFLQNRMLFLLIHDIILSKLHSGPSILFSINFLS